MANRSSGGGPNSSNSWRSGARGGRRDWQPRQATPASTFQTALVPCVGCEPALLARAPYELERVWENIG